LIGSIGTRGRIQAARVRPNYFFVDSMVTGVCGMSALVAIHNTSASSSLVETAA
jgi:hypothetical protein